MFITEIERIIISTFDIKQHFNVYRFRIHNS